MQTVLQPRYEQSMQDLLNRMRVSPILGGKDFRQILLERLDKLRIQIPSELPNWGTDVDFDDAGKIALDDGIPLAYIPPAGIVTKLLAAPTPEDRRTVLATDTAAITDACSAIVADPKITAAFPEYTLLAQAAVRALTDGHHQGAQALAVNVAESFVREWIAEKYHKVKKHVLEADPAKADPDEPWIPSRLRLEMMILPLLKFYDEWHPKSGKTAPADLSRHVTAHQATAAHYTPINALIAVMIMTSLLAGFTDAMT
jgi:hypothetical protein